MTKRFAVIFCLKWVKINVVIIYYFLIQPHVWKTAGSWGTAGNGSDCMSLPLTNVGNKAKDRISKRVLQEKAHQIFWKTNISYPLIRTRTFSDIFRGCRKRNLAWNRLNCMVLWSAISIEVFDLSSSV